MNRYLNMIVSRILLCRKKHEVESWPPRNQQSQNRKKRMKRNAKAALLTGALIASRLLGIPAVFDQNVLWALNDVLQCLQINAILCWLFISLPYDKLREKCVVASFFAISAVETCYLLLFYFAGINGYWYCLIAQIAAGLTFPVWYWSRTYTKQNDVLNQTHLFLLRRKPRNLRELIISMLSIGGPDGGYAIYYQEQVFRFRHGVFCVDDLSEFSGLQRHKLLEQYHIQQGARPSNQTLSALAGMYGTAWSYKNNCAKLYDLWRKDAK